MGNVMRCKLASISVVCTKVPEKSRTIGFDQVVDFDEVLYTRDGGVPFTLGQAVEGRRGDFESVKNTPAFAPVNPVSDGAAVDRAKE